MTQKKLTKYLTNDISRLIFEASNHKTTNTMNYLQKMICDKTQCSPQNVAEVEAVMRNVILNYQTVDSLSARALNKAIKDAHGLWVFMQTPEGKAQIERAEKEVMGE